MAMIAMPQVEPFLDSTALLEDPTALQERAQELGYLFFKGLLPTDTVLEVRRQVLEVAKKHGWLDPSVPLMDGIAQEGVSVLEGNDPRWQAFYCDMLKLRDFHALALHPAIMDALEKLFGEPALAHSRNICRVMFPHSAEFSTPPHQDYFYIGGTEQTWTGWIPLGDCPTELGSLAIAKSTHQQGLLPVHPAQGAGGNAVAVPEDAVWVNGDFSCGDVLLLNSLMIHQGSDNQTQNQLRFSADYRYQPLSHPVRSDSLLPHMGWIDWEELYADWAADEPLKYYWKDLPLQVVEREK